MRLFLQSICILHIISSPYMPNSDWYLQRYKYILHFGWEFGNYNRLYLVKEIRKTLKICLSEKIIGIYSSIHHNFFLHKLQVLKLCVVAIIDCIYKKKKKNKKNAQNLLT